MIARTNWGWTLVATGALALGACDRQADPVPTPSPTPDPTAADEGAKRSIFRPEFQVEPIEAAAPVLAPLETRIYFPEGTALTEDATAELATVIASPQVRRGGAITLGGHSDSGGTDQANLRASRARAEAVRDWLVDNGIDEERIELVAFGEQNPIAPNALPDGTPNEEGRATNRRVEITVASPDPAAAQPEEPTLAETLAAPAADAAKGE